MLTALIACAAGSVIGWFVGGMKPRRVIVYGDAFSEDSPRACQLSAQRIVDKALGR